MLFEMDLVHTSGFFFYPEKVMFCLFGDSQKDVQKLSPAPAFLSFGAPPTL